MNDQESLIAETRSKSSDDRTNGPDYAQHASPHGPWTEPNWTPLMHPRLMASSTMHQTKIKIGKCKIQQGHNVTPPTLTGKKASKKGLKKDVSPLFHQPENSPSDSLPDSSTSGNDYRALRRKYLLLEEESFGLGTELREVEDEVKTLEEEKIALLNELVVLEGLIDPSELQSQGPRLP
ncbi:hypothetical protein RHSIM_Rhsim10G0190200 [Rhododendron simsii]|uniref:Uncharacterized protein n=1 Tax=Rhododendron simsii TaxID=118357 RepID=A0A834GBA0_RHOSS|nr:hypothetical protein RHSIM_Rhsim10G0190200 [Rhododendron simsii]